MRRLTKKIDELVVRPRYSSRRRLFIAALGSLGFISMAFVLYNHGLAMAGFDRSAVNARQQALADEIAKLQAENQSLREALSRAELLVRTNRTAYLELDQTLKGSAQEMLKLREELDFYRSIISPANKIGGLQLQRLSILPGNDAGQYRYKLVLIQALKHERNVDGRVRFEVVGARGGASLKLGFPASARGIGFNFKYFQEVEGKWDLPVGFNPEAVIVRVTPTHQGNEMEKTFPWPRAG